MAMAQKLWAPFHCLFLPKNTTNTTFYFLKVFKEWKVWAAQRRFQKNCVAQCLSTRAATILEQFWLSWKMTASRRAYRSRCVTICIFKLRRSHAAKAFAKWREEAKYRSHTKSVLAVSTTPPTPPVFSVNTVPRNVPPVYSTEQTPR
jgi:hypothetical protein